MDFSLFLLSNARFPALATPQFLLSPVFPETSQGHSAKSRRLRHHLPPGACATHCPASSTPECTSVRVVGVRARARLAGRGGSLTMKGIGFPPLPQRSVVAQAR